MGCYGLRQASAITKERKETPKTMASTSNLEDMPQLVLEKIVSFLNHKQLLTLEQVSRKMKRAVDTHFSLSEHLIIGYLPYVEYEDDYEDGYEFTAKDKKNLNNLLKIIKRCGIRLRTIQITTQYHLPKAYFVHIFGSAEMSDNCPNVENIITFPKMDIVTTLTYPMFRQQNVLLDAHHTDIYANKIKLTNGVTCKLRYIKLCSRQENGMEELCKRVLNLYSNLEQIAVYDYDENFIQFLPQFIQKGLKDLHIYGIVSIPNVEKYCIIGKNLRTLRITDIYLTNIGDITALNNVQLPGNVELGIKIPNNCLTLLSEKVCNFIIKCEDIETFDMVDGETDYRSLSKLKNVKSVLISNSDQLKVIAEGSFPELKQIGNVSDQPNMSDFHTFLPQLITDKGNQLIIINIQTRFLESVNIVWKALKYCKAAKVISCGHSHEDSQITDVTYEDVKAICHLPNLQQFTFQASYWKVRRYWLKEYGTCYLLCDLVKRAAKERKDFQFKRGIYKHTYILYRMNF